jgi:signal transduction histidine kinase
LDPNDHTSVPADRQAAILVVDDDPRNRALLRGYLQSQYDVLEAGSGPEALELMARAPVDLVLLDVMMPGMSGFDVCREVKKRTDKGVLPVLMLTALSEQEDRNSGLQAGADDFLSKPVNRHELALRVAAFLRLRQQDQLVRRQFEELRLLDALKDDLVSLMVHDLRNPLAAVLAHLNMLRAEIQDPELKEEAAAAFGAAAKLRETLNDMLQVRLLEEGKLVLNLEVHPIADVVTEAIASIKPAATERGVQVGLEAEGHPALPLDRKLVGRAVENVLSNALRYSPSHGRVDVQVHAAEDGVEITVADRGPGVPDVLKASLFEKFGSVEAAKGEARRGYGLGLYLVRLVASAHGGRAVVRNREGGGSVFGLWLPASRSQV